MDRRRFIRNTAIAAGGFALGPAFWDGLYARAAGADATGGLRLRAPYGPLQDPDENGLRLPEGFTSRIVATSGEAVGDTAYTWHFAPDGGACFRVPGDTGAFVYVSNSEVPLVGGVSALRVGPAGRIQDAYRILTGTTLNCAGGPTPWGTWLSGEEHPNGQIWECNPFAASQGTARPALGTFSHEAATVDPVREHLYLTEDQGDGRLYRFIPDAYPDLTSGRLQVARLRVGGAVVPEATEVTAADVSWVTVAEGTAGATAPRPANSTGFDGGEGIWWDSGFVYFTTKGDNRVWKLDTTGARLDVLYDDDLSPNAPLHGVDNVTVNAAGEVLVAEDGDNMQINVIRQRAGTVGPLLRVTGQPGSEITGPAFSPRGDRLYFSSQRANDGSGAPVGGIGLTYEVRGPFRGAR